MPAWKWAGQFIIQAVMTLKSIFPDFINIHMSLKTVNNCSNVSVWFQQTYTSLKSPGYIINCRRSSLFQNAEKEIDLKVNYMRAILNYTWHEN